MSILGRSLWFATGGGPLFVASAKTSNVGAGTTLVIAKPTGTIQGDLMIAFMCCSGGGGPTWTGDTSWSELIDQTAAPSIRVASLVAGASEGASYTFTCSNSRVLSGIIVTYRAAAYDTIGTINTSNPIVAPQITAAVSNSVLLGFFADTGSSATFSTPSNMLVVDSDSDANLSSWALFSQSVGAGATGTKTSTSSSGTGGGLLLSIKPG